MSIVLTVGVGLTVYAWLLSLISTVLPLWTYQNQGTQYQHAGLWKNCTVRDDNSDCKRLTEGWIRTVQAFMVMSVLVLFVSMVTGFLRLQDESKRKVAIISTLSVLIGGFMVTIAAIVYGSMNGANKSKFSAGFYLSIISAVTSFLAAFLFIIFKRRSGENGYTRIDS